MEQQRVAGNEVMRARTKVLLETREENFGALDAAADHRAAFKNQYAITRLGEVRGTDEAVVSSARHHVVEDRRTCPRAGLRRDVAGLRRLHGAGRSCGAKGREDERRESR